MSRTRSRAGRADPRSGRRGALGAVLAVVAVVAVLAALATWWRAGQQGQPEDGLGADPGASSSAVASPSGPGYGQGPDDPSTRHGTDPESGLLWVSAAELPPEAARTLDLIDAGGPYPYSEDGSHFGNFEGLLPDRRSGYYAEYTVPTPGEDDRGARRIVTGDGGEFYYTPDHYESFQRIDPTRGSR